MPPHEIHETACGYAATSLNPLAGSKSTESPVVAQSPLVQPPTSRTFPSMTAAPPAATGDGFCADAVLHELAAGSNTSTVATGSPASLQPPNTYSLPSTAAACGFSRAVGRSGSSAHA